MLLKRTAWFWKSGLAAISFILIVIVAGKSFVKDTEKVSFTEGTKNAEEEAAEQWEKGYGLPVDEQEKKEAANDCKKMMELIFDIYKGADKGTASNVVLNDETVLEMQKRLMETDCPVSTLVTYSNMENYESVDCFLEECIDGKSGSVMSYVFQSRRKSAKL